jgi:hypothetical protein
LTLNELPAADLPGRRLALYVAGMDSSSLTPEQLDRLKKTIERHLRFYNRLEGRMHQKHFPRNDPLVEPVTRARAAIYDLNNAIHYAQVKTGVGR